MSKTYFLTPGPAELYFTVEHHIKEALKTHVPSISHRSQTFRDMFAHTDTQLRQLLNVPSNFHIVFLSSATEAWERVIQNLVHTHSYHLVNGSFSRKFYDFAVELGKNAQKYEVEEGEGFDLDSIEVAHENELICVTQNETSTGVSFPLDDLAALRSRYPDALIAVDAVSAVPYPEFDFNTFDTLFFSVQKCFGLPAGLGVWIFNDRCVAKANELKAKGLHIGTYHALPALLSNAKKWETPETPNVLNIYLLGKVAEDMNRRTAQAIRHETNYKAVLTYYHIAQHPDLEVFVKNEKHQSKTVIVANVLSGNAKNLMNKAKEYGFVLGAGYGKNKDSQIRIANFPTHSKETFEKLVEVLAL